MDDWLERIHLIGQRLVEEPEELLELASDGGARCITVNAEIALILLAMPRTDFDVLMRGRVMCTVDGVGFRVLLRLLLGQWFKPLRGSTWCQALLGPKADPPVGICVIGGPDEARAVLKERFADRGDVSLLGGRFSPAGEPEDPRFFGKYLRTSALVDLVALGTPKGMWLSLRLERTGTARLRLEIGGGVAFAAGLMPRAPRWVQRLGAEWLFRLLVSPSRLPRAVRSVGMMGLVLLAVICRQHRLVPRLLARSRYAAAAGLPEDLRAPGDGIRKAA